MHLPDGVLEPAVAIVGGIGAAGGLAVGTWRLTPERIPRAGVLAAVFFVASLIHIPCGVGSVHLLLVGLAGILLGWAVFPALTLALLLQAVFFQHGGFSSLGVNALAMAGAGLVAGTPRLVLRRRHPPWVAFVCGATAGGLGVVLAALLMSMALWASGRELQVAAGALLILHLPVALVEGVITGFAVMFLDRVRPEGFRAVPPSEELS